MSNVERHEEPNGAQTLKTWRTLEIAGLEVKFPTELEPHKPQLIIMNQVIRCLQRAQNACIESPTGTGKSLALLCSALAWLEKEKERSEPSLSAVANHADMHSEFKPETEEPADEKQSIPKLLPESRSAADDCGVQDVDDDDDDDDFTSRPAPRVSQLKSASQRWRQQGAVAGTRHRYPLCGKQVPLNPLCSVAVHLEGTNLAVEQRHPRIFFCSRTHAQLSQVIAEMRRTPYAGKMRSTLLASRKHYCVHEDIQRAPSTLQAEACQRAVQLSFMEEAKSAADASSTVADPLAGISPCFYHHSAAVRRTACSAPQPFQMEDLVQVGRHWHGCPYFASRFLVHGDIQTEPNQDPVEGSSVPDERSHTGSASSTDGAVSARATSCTTRTRTIIEPADIIFSPYSYLVDPLIRRRMDIDITGAVLIIDEAHNIEEVCLEAASVDVSLSQVQRVLLQLDHYLGVQMPETEPTLETLMVRRPSLNGTALLRVFRHWLQALASFIETRIPLLDDIHGIPESHRPTSGPCTAAQRLHAQATVFWQDGALLHELEVGFFQNFDFEQWNWSMGQLNRFLDRWRQKQQRTVPALASGMAASTGFGTETATEEPAEQSVQARPTTGDERAETEPRFASLCGEVLHLLERFHIALQFIYGGQSSKGAAAPAEASLLHATDYRLVLRREMRQGTYGGVEFKLGLWCMNPAIAFRHLRDNARSIVLTSGTLSPMESFRSELATDFLCQTECDHIIDPEKHVRVCVVGTSSSGDRLEGSYRTSATWSYQDAIGEALAHCSAQIPDGVLCFMPCYRVLESMLQRWSSTGAIERICGAKRLFIERSSGQVITEYATETAGGYRLQRRGWRDSCFTPAREYGTDASMAALGERPSSLRAASSSILSRDRSKRKRRGAGRAYTSASAYANRDALQVYYDAVDAARTETTASAPVPAANARCRITADHKNGAIMLAVCRGKISEGLNFADQYGRAVIMVGIPYPNLTDTFVQLKMRYNDERSGAVSGAPINATSTSRLSGKQWYVLQAHRTVNQALGRCIRNPKDYASIILLDVRYRDTRTVNCMCRWIRDPLRDYIARHGQTLTLEAAVREVAEFFFQKYDAK